MSEGDLKPIPGRDCGGCTMCCKLLAVPALDKPPMKWCAHCTPGTGCNIYEQRPAECRGFFCEYLLAAHMDEAWAPTRSRMVVAGHKQDGSIMVYVDPSRKDAWRKQPFYGDLKAWAATLYPQRRQLVVLAGDEVIVILPNTDKNLGRPPTAKFNVQVYEKQTPQGTIYGAAFVAESSGSAPGGKA